MNKLVAFGGSVDGIHRLVVFAYSRAHAARLLEEVGITVVGLRGLLRDHFSETFNDAEIGLSSAPSVWRTHMHNNCGYVRLRRAKAR